MVHEGLVFLKNRGNGYTLDRVGTCKDADIVIPSVWEGLPVTMVEGHAFEGCDFLRSVKIPEAVTLIGDYAFQGSGVESLELPKSLEYIEEGAFKECESLKKVIVPTGISSIEYAVFERCTSLISVLIPEGVTSVGKDAFAYCRNLRYITLPDSVTSLGAWAFSCCYNLSNVVLGKGLERIGSNAFYQCGRLKHIFYRGILADWIKLTIEERNEKDCLSSDILYCYSESVPGRGGKYWHYDYDGVPTVWRD